MLILETEILEVIPRAANVKSFRFRAGKDMEFQAGQFFFVTIRVEGKESTKPFSFSNSPTEKGYVEFTKRITESAYSRALDKMRPGDKARLKLPSGNFTLNGEYPRIAFLSGGIGITPIRSMCRFAADKGLPVNIVLLYGNNRQEDIIFRQDLDELAKINKNMRVVYTLTAADINRQAWTGRTGYIDARMLKEEIPDYPERVFYLCGPPVMVSGLMDTLKNALSVAENKIRIENFAGY
ncbi:MAG: FAD-dependent oxidoreductase [Candidatus Omnitrophota bacterium]